jgi:NADH-quinone oxidoreductase subunit H
LDKFLLDTFGNELIKDLIIPVPLFAFVIVFALYAVLAERKISAFMQNRPGPNRVGGRTGIFQPIADALKLLQKEMVLPERADKWLYWMAPFVVFMGTLLGFAIIPFSSIYVGVDLNIGLFYFFAITSISVVGMLMGGWSSNNKYSLYGSMRSVAQIVSYEIPTALAALNVVMIAGTLSMQKFSELQAGGIQNWFILGGPGGLSKIIIIPFMVIATLILFISTLAEANRTPFDLVEADSEIVAGVHLEYAGMQMVMFLFAEYAQMFAVSGVVVTLFLGGWQSPFGESIAFLNTPWMQFVWFIGKGLFFVFVQIWLRWTLPRLRVDQLMTLCWKYLIPIALVCVFAVGLYLVL